MLSSELWMDIDSRWKDIFLMIPETVFSDISVMTVADLL